MLQLSQLAVEMPRISANQLAEFIFSTENRKKQILRDQKFKNIHSAPYYSPSGAAIRRAFKDGRLNEGILLREASLLDVRALEEIKNQRKRKWENNALALRCLAEISEECNPPIGSHRMLGKNAIITVDGVRISVYPEIVTENLEQGSIVFTKFRHSKKKFSADASEIVLLILHYYGLTQERAGLKFDFPQSKVIDCFSKSVIEGHSVGRHRDQQLHQALAEILALWPFIKKPSGNENHP